MIGNSPRRPAPPQPGSRGSEILSQAAAPTDRLGFVDLPQFVETHWAQAVRRIEVLTGGLNSETWTVTTATGRYVLKSVPAHDAGFIRGLELAASLDRRGVPTGAPIRTVAGSLFERTPDRSVALLRWVDGEPLSAADPRSGARMGSMLARVHEAGATEPDDLETWLRILPFGDDYLDYEPWIRPAVENTLEATRELHARSRMTWVGLHGDPSPSSFLVRGDDTGLIDWGATMFGPALYDLASAAMYLGCSIDEAGPEFVVRAVEHPGSASGSESLVAGYLAARPGMIDEVRLGFGTYLRVRLCVQAGYFAWRCANDIRTGINSAEENQQGLRHARESWGIQT
ncbi:hypothetical protein GCM10028864_43240 [Microlunatus parietis]